MSATVIDNLGPAASGFPANAAERIGERLYVASLGLQPARLAEYDLGSRTVTGSVDIPTGLRTWAVTSVEAELYLGMWGTGSGEANFYRFDSASRRLVALETIPTDGEFWALEAAPDGRTLYLGTARSGRVLVYDRVRGALDALQFPDPSGSQVTALAATADTLYVGLGRKQAGLVAIDVSSGASEHILAEQLAGAVGVYDLQVTDDVVVAGLQDDPARLAVVRRDDPSAYQIVETDGEHAIGAILIEPQRVYFAGLGSGALYALERDSGALQTVATPVAHVPTRRLLRSRDGLTGVSAPGIVFTYEPETGEVSRTDLVTAGARGGVERPQSLTVAAGRVVVGTNNAAEIHAGDAEGSRRVVLPGEAKTAVAIGDVAYLATYPGGQLWRVPADAGPERVVDWPDLQNRPRALHHDATTGLLLIATNSDFAGGGALVVTDGNGQRLEVHVDPLSQRQAPNAVASLPDGVAVLGGIGDDARLAALDALTGERLWEAVPVPGGMRISGLAVRDGTVYGLTRDATLFAFDVASQTVTARTRLAAGRTGEVLVDGDVVYAVDGARLVRADRDSLEVTSVVDDVTHTAFTPNPPVRMDERHRLYLFDGTDLLRVTDGRRSR